MYDECAKKYIQFSVACKPQVMTGGQGESCMNFGVGMCRWDPETFSLFKS